MLGSSPFIGFVAATDLARARAFYEGTLGLTVTEDTPFACVVDAGGTMLRITAVPDHAAAGYTVAGWRVDDIAATVRALGERGVRLERFDGMDQDDLGIWTTPDGGRVAWFKDPDGNTLSLSEFA